MIEDLMRWLALMTIAYTLMTSLRDAREARQARRRARNRNQLAGLAHYRQAEHTLTVRVPDGRLLGLASGPVTIQLVEPCVTGPAWGETVLN